MAEQAQLYKWVISPFGRSQLLAHSYLLGNAARSCQCWSQWWKIKYPGDKATTLTICSGKSFLVCMMSTENPQLWEQVRLQTTQIQVAVLWLLPTPSSPYPSEKAVAMLCPVHYGKNYWLANQHSQSSSTLFLSTIEAGKSKSSLTQFLLQLGGALGLKSS